MLHHIRRTLFSTLLLLGLLVSFVQPAATQAVPLDQQQRPSTEVASSSPQDTDAAFVPEWRPAGLAATASDQVKPSAQIEQALLDALTTKGTADFVVLMAEQPDLSAAYRIEELRLDGLVGDRTPWFPVENTTAASVGERTRSRGTALRR